MNNQLKELNSNIKGKNRKIKQTYKSMNKVRVYFTVSVANSEDVAVARTCELKTLKEAYKIFNLLAVTEGYKKRIRRVQTSGYCGGIIMNGSIEIVEEV